MSCILNNNIRIILGLSFIVILFAHPYSSIARSDNNNEKANKNRNGHMDS